MRKKEEIMADTIRVGKNENLIEQDLALLVELLCDIRDDQIAHNNEMERLAHCGGQ